MDNKQLRTVQGGIWDAETLLAYRKGELPEHLRVRLEAAMEEDPFLKDAVEGLSEADPETILAALSALDKRVSEQTAPRTSMVISPTLKRYLAAATILLFLSATILVMSRLNTQANEAQIAMQTEKEQPAFNNADGMGSGSAAADTFILEREATPPPHPAKTEAGAADKLVDIKQAETSKDAYASEEVETDDVVVSSTENITLSNGNASHVAIDEYSFSTTVPAAIEGYTLKENALVLRISGAYYAQVDAESASLEEVDVLSKVVVASESKKRTKSSTKEKSEAPSTAGSTADFDDMVADSTDNFAKSAPQYPGGKAALDIYLNTYMQIPMDGSIGTIYVSATISAEGKVTEATIRQGLSTSANTEALRVISNMPDWIPAYSNGVPVSVPVTIMVTLESN